MYVYTVYGYAHTHVHVRKYGVFFLAVTNTQNVQSARVPCSSAVEVTAGVCSAATARVGKEVLRSSAFLSIARSVVYSNHHHHHKYSLLPADDHTLQHQAHMRQSAWICYQPCAVP